MQMKSSESDNSSSGFRVHYFRDLANPGTLDLRTITLDESVPFDTHTSCPACGMTLSVLCTFIAGNDAKRMRLGFCPTCGYQGYMDRPTAEWTMNYYVEEWDNAKLKDVKREVAEVPRGLTHQQRLTVRMADRPEVSKKRPVCDIGCGDGLVLKEFENIGFSNLIGVEHSRFRAEMAKEKFGYPMIIGNFEGKEVSRELAAHAPIGVFFTFHVMEHVYEPCEVIRTASKLQKEGDIFILAMPDGMGEPKVTTLFWLPHLHAYTHVALERILNAYGYEVIDDNLEFKKHLIVACRKVDGIPKTRYQPAADYGALYKSGVLDYFLLNRADLGKRYCFSWTSKVYHTDLRHAPQWEWIDRIIQRYEQAYWYIVSRALGRFANKRSMVISRLAKRMTSPEESSLEIQFDGPIQMLLR